VFHHSAQHCVGLSAQLDLVAQHLGADFCELVVHLLGGAAAQLVHLLGQSVHGGVWVVLRPARGGSAVGQGLLVLVPAQHLVGFVEEPHLLAQGGAQLWEVSYGKECPSVTVMPAPDHPDCHRLPAHPQQTLNLAPRIAGDYLGCERQGGIRALIVSTYDNVPAGLARWLELDEIWATVTFTNPCRNYRKIEVE
jgi:hypothetical protein